MATHAESRYLRIAVAVTLAVVGAVIASPGNAGTSYADRSANNSLLDYEKRGGQPLVERAIELLRRVEAGCS
jgi:hypothetical protein